MTENCLTALRSEIDSIDRELVNLLAKRFQTVDRVIATKRRSAIPAHVQARVDEVISNAKSDAVDRGLPADSIERLWQVLVAETIKYEQGQGVSSH